MKSVNQRLFHCKDEELPVVLKAVAFAFRRDLADFSAFSLTFTEAYATDFETRFTTVCDLLHLLLWIDGFASKHPFPKCRKSYCQSACGLRKYSYL